MGAIETGVAITAIDPKQTRFRSDRPRYLKAYVISIGWTKTENGRGNWTSTDYFNWSCGKIVGQDYMHDEGIKWVRGHGPMARAALEAAQRMLKGL